MFKKPKIEVAECIGDQYVFPSDKKKMSEMVMPASFVAGGSMALPSTVFAETGVGTFNAIHESVNNMANAGIVLVFIFAGALWALGNRPKAFELLLGAGAGYLIILNAVNIRDFLQSLVPDTGGL